MNIDAELGVWRRDWQSATALPSDLVRRPQPDVVLLALVTWLFLAIAWVFALIINRGNRSPSALNATSFVELFIRRCRSRLATVWFGAALFVAEIAFSLGWIYRHSAPPRKSLSTWLFFRSLPIDFVWLLTLAFFGVLLWYRRMKRSELATY